jgi:hypothetical protein
MVPQHFLRSKELNLAFAYSQSILLLDGFVVEENFVALVAHSPNVGKNPPAT